MFNDTSVLQNLLFSSVIELHSKSDKPQDKILNQSRTV